MLNGSNIQGNGARKSGLIQTPKSKEKGESFRYIKKQPPAAPEPTPANQYLIPRLARKTPVHPDIGCLAQV